MTPSKRTGETAALEAVGARIDYLHRDVGDILKSVASNLDALTIQVAQMNAGVKENSRNIDRLTVRIDNLTQSVEGHLQVAQQQALNIGELSKLVATQAATVNRLLDRGIG